MNYADEDYVRYYTRDTVTWLALEFEGQAVMVLMLHGRFNRSGIFDCGGHDPSHAVTLATRCPPDIAAKGLKRLLATGTWILRNGNIIWPNFILAQTCKRSDRSRKQESRENLAMAALGDQSHLVTRGHTPSQPVTPKPKPLPKPKPKPRGEIRNSPTREQAPSAPTPSTSPAPEPTVAAPARPVVTPTLPLQERAALWLRDTVRASLEAPDPGSWPETLELQQRVLDRFQLDDTVALKGHTDQRVLVPLKRWAEGITQDQLLQAIDGAATDPYVRAQRGRMTVQFILREASSVSEFCDLARPEPVRDRSNKTKLTPEAAEIRRKFLAGEKT